MKLRPIRHIAVYLLSMPAIALAAQTSKVDQAAANEASKRVGLSSWIVQAIAKMKPRTQDQKEVCDCIDTLAEAAPGSAGRDLIESSQSATSTVSMHTVLMAGLQQAALENAGVAECRDLFSGSGRYSLESFDRSSQGTRYIGRETGTNRVMDPVGVVGHLNASASMLYGCSQLIAHVAEKVMEEVRQAPPEDQQAAVGLAAGKFARVSFQQGSWSGHFVTSPKDAHPFMDWKTVPVQVTDADGRQRSAVMSFSSGEHKVVVDGVTVFSKDQINGARMEIALSGGGSFTGSAAGRDRKKALQDWSKCLLAFNSITTQLSDGLVRMRELPHPSSKAAQGLLLRANFAEALGEAQALTAGNLRLDMNKGGVRWRIGRFAFDMGDGQPSIKTMGSTWFSENHASGQEISVQAKWSRSLSNGFAFN